MDPVTAKEKELQIKNKVCPGTNGVMVAASNNCIRRCGKKDIGTNNMICAIMCSWSLDIAQNLNEVKLTYR